MHGLIHDALDLHGGGVISIVGAGGKTSLMFALAQSLIAAGETVLTTTTTKIFFPPPACSPKVVISPSVPDLLAQAPDLLARHHHITAGRGFLPQANKLTGYSVQEMAALFSSTVFKWIIAEADGAARRPLKAPADHEPVIPDCSRWLFAVVGLDAIGCPLAEETVFRSAIYTDITGLKPGAPVDPASVAAALLHKHGIMKSCPETTRRYVFLNKADTPRRLKAGEAVAKVLMKKGTGAIHRIFIGCTRPRPLILKTYGPA